MILCQVDEMEDKRTTWTMRGWRETLKDGTQVMRAEPITQTDLEREKEDKQKVKSNLNYLNDESQRVTFSTVLSLFSLPIFL